MKTMKLLLCLLVLFVVAASGAFAETVRHAYVWCENRQSYTSVFFVFDDNGRLLRASGIDCHGNGWTKEYGIYTGPAGEDHSIKAWIVSLALSRLQVSASQSVDFQLVDLSSSELPAIGEVKHCATANEPVIFDISALPAGTYGVIVTRDGGTVDMLTFDKR